MMVGIKLLAEWFWTDRWIGSSGFLLPMEARGLYREMLTQCWRREGRLPNNHEAIRRATGCTLEEWNRCWPLVERFWRVEGDALVNDTQREIMAQAESLRHARSEAGSRGGKSRAERAARLRAAREIATHTEAEWSCLVLACGGVCVRCGSSEELHRDHVIPLYQVELEPSDGIENLQPLCRTCNAAKGPDSTDFRPAGWQERFSSKIQAKVQAKERPPSPSLSPISISDKRSDASHHSRAGARSVRRRPESPEALAEAFRTILPELPQPHDPLAEGVREKLRKALERDTVAGWSAYFTAVRDSDFLMGRATNFTADLAFLLGRENRAKWEAGSYRNRKPTKPSAPQSKTKASMEEAERMWPGLFGEEPKSSPAAEAPKQIPNGSEP